MQWYEKGPTPGSCKFMALGMITDDFAAASKKIKTPHLLHVQCQIFHGIGRRLCNGMKEDQSPPPPPTFCIFNPKGSWHWLTTLKWHQRGPKPPTFCMSRSSGSFTTLAGDYSEHQKTTKAPQIFCMPRSSPVSFIALNYTVHVQTAADW